MRVALYDDAAFREHDAGPGHPERPERLDAVRRGIRDAGIEGRLVLRTPRPATRDELLRVHTAAHVDRVAATAGRTVRFDPDTAASSRSYDAAVRAAGAVAEAVDRALDGEGDRAFCAVRQPGHHAESGRAMGFCLFNNVAVGAAHALARGLERVLIVDFDVHHGNGTQEIFYGDPRVLYLSTHEFPFYPGTGAADEVGEGAGRGFTVNLPLPAGCGDAEYRLLYSEIAEPIAAAYDPQLVLVSAGFDAHAADPLAGMRLTERGFASVAASCLRSASGAAKGRTVMVLEGGYDLEAMAASAATVVGSLLAQGVESGRGVGPSTPLASALVDRHRRAFAPYWPSLGV